MAQAILFILAGIAVGFFFKEKEKFLVCFEKISSATIYLLLFLMGLAVGTNATVLNSFPKVGKIAIVLTFGALTGSIVFSFIIDRLFFKE